METVFKPAWKSFYKDFIVMMLVLIAAGAVQYVKSGSSWLKWMWLAVAVAEVILFLYAALKRSMMSLVLRDNPDSPANQEIAFITCNPLKPLSSDFRRSVEIGLSNIMHIEVGQTAMQTLFNIGDIIITSSGTGGEEIRAKNIPDPSGVRDTIQEHARRYAKGEPSPEA